MDKERLEQEIVQQKQRLANIEEILANEHTKEHRKEWIKVNKVLLELTKTLILMVGKEEVIKYQPEVKIGLMVALHLIGAEVKIEKVEENTDNQN